MAFDPLRLRALIAEAIRDSLDDCKSDLEGREPDYQSAEVCLTEATLFMLAARHVADFVPVVFRGRRPYGYVHDDTDGMALDITALCPGTTCSVAICVAGDGVSIHERGGMGRDGPDQSLVDAGVWDK